MNGWFIYAYRTGSTVAYIPIRKRIKCRPIGIDNFEYFGKPSGDKREIAEKVRVLNKLREVAPVQQRR